MKAPRGLTAGERAAWARLARTVEPLNPPRHVEGDHPKDGGGGQTKTVHSGTGPLRQPPLVRRLPPPHAGEDQGGLDSSWERKLRSAKFEPDFTLDLHGHSLDAAHARLERGLGQAKALNARLVLVIAGKPRPAEAADRGARRGAIRAKVLDWLAAGPHAADIAAIRPAHRRHGGEGALYIVIRRKRT